MRARHISKPLSLRGSLRVGAGPLPLGREMKTSVATHTVRIRDGRDVDVAPICAKTSSKRLIEAAKRRGFSGSL